MVHSTSKINSLQRPVTPPRTRRRRVLPSFICRFLFSRSSVLWLVFMILFLLREAYFLYQRMTVIFPDQLADPKFHQWVLLKNTCTETLLGPSQCFTAGNSAVDVRVLGLALNISIAALDKSRIDISALLDNRNKRRDHLTIPQKDSLGRCMALIERTLHHLQAARAGADLDSSKTCRRHRNLELLLSMAVEDQESCLRDVPIGDDGSVGQNRLKSIIKELEFPNLRMVNSALALARELEKSCWENVNSRERKISKSNHSHRHPPMLYRSPRRPAWSGKKTAGVVEDKKTVQRRSSSDDYWEL
ncbi:hypothetical protein NE237_025150 [Protea cynaroides]|uniref:Pectinesterase inhibitor domain-containing protein n=1 Tax=Protea cynaroides TaxID=273540 RepID=A0A9Q0JZ86_9MAGN|nr:hypothetical protein NE237_025150 [Protea cynaroides]